MRLDELIIGGVDESQISDALTFECEGFDVSFIDYAAGQQVKYAYIPADVIQGEAGPAALDELQSIETLSNVELVNEGIRTAELPAIWVNWLRQLRLKFLCLENFHSIDEFVRHHDAFYGLHGMCICGASVNLSDFTALCGIQTIRSIRFQGQILGADHPPAFLNRQLVALTLIGSKLDFNLLKLVRCLPELRELNVDVMQIQPALHEIRMEFPKCSVNVCEECS